MGTINIRFRQEKLGQLNGFRMVDTSALANGNGTAQGIAQVAKGAESFIHGALRGANLVVEAVERRDQLVANKALVDYQNAFKHAAEASGDENGIGAGYITRAAKNNEDAWRVNDSFEMTDEDCLKRVKYEDLNDRQKELFNEKNSAFKENMWLRGEKVANARLEASAQTFSKLAVEHTGNDYVGNPTEKNYKTWESTFDEMARNLHLEPEAAKLAKAKAKGNLCAQSIKQVMTTFTSPEQFEKLRDALKSSESKALEEAIGHPATFSEDLTSEQKVAIESAITSAQSRFVKMQDEKWSGAVDSIKDAVLQGQMSADQVEVKYNELKTAGMPIRQLAAVSGILRNVRQGEMNSMAMAFINEVYDNKLGSGDINKRIGEMRASGASAQDVSTLVRMAAQARDDESNIAAASAGSEVMAMYEAEGKKAVGTRLSLDALAVAAQARWDRLPEHIKKDPHFRSTFVQAFRLGPERYAKLVADRTAIDRSALELGATPVFMTVEERREALTSMRERGYITDTQLKDSLETVNALADKALSDIVNDMANSFYEWWEPVKTGWFSTARDMPPAFGRIFINGTDFSAASISKVMASQLSEEERFDLDKVGANARFASLLSESIATFKKALENSDWTPTEKRQAFVTLMRQPILMMQDRVIDMDNGRYQKQMEFIGRLNSVAEFNDESKEFTALPPSGEMGVDYSKGIPQRQRSSRTNENYRGPKPESYSQQ